MENFSRLFKLLETTRSMPQTGYALVGIEKGQLSDLAQHQYLVTMIAWQLARGANRSGAKLDVLKVMELAMVHDLGELFGSDIAMPYARVNKRAKKFAMAFESENHKFLVKFFGDDKKYLTWLFAEIMNQKTDEGLVAKLADDLESAHYRLYMKKMDKKDFAINQERLDSYLKKVKGKELKNYLSKFLKLWQKEFFVNYDSHNIMHSLSD